jgi:hypothetical protein
MQWKHQNKSMLKTTTFTLVFATFMLGFANRARADITATIPNYDGAPSFGPFPETINIGDFNFTPPTGVSVVSVIVSGTFGNTDVPGTTDTSAPSDLYIDNGLIKVAECDDSLSYNAACDTGSSPTPWSFTLPQSDLAELAPELAAGRIDFSAVQNGFFAVNTGSVTLDIVVTPEPSSFLLLGSMIAGFGLLRRRRKN